MLALVRFFARWVQTIYIPMRWFRFENRCSRTGFENICLVLSVVARKVFKVFINFFAFVTCRVVQPGEATLLFCPRVKI